MIRSSSTRVGQPTGPVEIDWANPLAEGLQLDITPSAGLGNLARRGDLLNSRSNTYSVSQTGIFSAGGETDYAATVSITNSITLFTIMRARSGGYLYADGDRTILSSRNASNQGWSWGRGAAASGGAFGNVTAQTITLQGIARYAETNSTIPSDLDTPVAVRYNKATGVISWFANGVKSSADTSASTGGLTGGGLVYRQQGPFSGSSGRYLDLLNFTRAWQRLLSDDEIASISENPWQLYRPAERRIWVGAAGGGPVTGIASGAPASLTLSSPAASAAGKAQATATPASLSLSAPTATASATPSASPGIATGTLASITLAAPTATAAGKAQATAAPAQITITPAQGSAAGKAQAAGSPASLSLSNASATATGKAQATGEPAQITLSAPDAIAFGGASGVAIGTPASISLSAATAQARGSAVASAAYAGLSLSAPTATASTAPSAAAGNAFGTPAGLSLLAPTGTARGAARAFAAYTGIAITAPTGTASAADPRGFAVGAFASVALSAPMATASVFDPAAFARAPSGGGFYRAPINTARPFVGSNSRTPRR